MTRKKRDLYSNARINKEMTIEFVDSDEVIHLGWTIKEVSFRDGIFVKNILLKSNNGSTLNCKPKTDYSIPTPTKGLVEINFRNWLNWGTPEDFNNGKSVLAAVVKF